MPSPRGRGKAREFWIEDTRTCVRWVYLAVPENLDAKSALESGGLRFLLVREVRRRTARKRKAKK